MKISPFEKNIVRKPFKYIPQKLPRPQEPPLAFEAAALPELSCSVAVLWIHKRSGLQGRMMRFPPPCPQQSIHNTAEKPVWDTPAEIKEVSHMDLAWKMWLGKYKSRAAAEQLRPGRWLWQMNPTWSEETNSNIATPRHDEPEGKSWKYPS